MNRDQIEFALSELHDRTLSPAQESQVREMLSVHPEAAGSLAELASLDSLLHTVLPAPEYDAEAFEARVLAALDRAAPPTSTELAPAWRRHLLRIAAVVLVGLAVAAGVLLHSPGRETTTPNRVSTDYAASLSPGAASPIAPSATTDTAVGAPASVIAVTISAPSGTPSLAGLAAVTHVAVSPPSDPGFMDRALAFDLFPGRPVVVIDRPIPSVEDAPVPF